MLKKIFYSLIGILFVIGIWILGFLSTMVEVKRRERETTGAMLRRFTRRVQLSGVLLNSRKKRFYKGKITKRMVHESALRRIAVQKERKRLEKLGKLKDEKKQSNR